MKVQDLPVGTYLNVLDKDGFMVEPYICQSWLHTYPQYWTLDDKRYDIGYYKAQYINCTIDKETGQFYGGEWVDSGSAPIPNYVGLAEAQKYEYMLKARYVIDPLQDAVDMDEATLEEIALLRKWKKYRVALNRVDLNTAPAVVWPDMPEEE